MPSNIFAPQLAESSANINIQNTAVDTSGATLLSTLGGLAVEGGRQAAVGELRQTRTRAAESLLGRTVTRSSSKQRRQLTVTALERDPEVSID